MTIELLDTYWRRVRAEVPNLPAAVPEAWAFGATPEHADSLLGLVLSGIKTGTASSVWDYEAAGDRMPEAGDLSVILDSAGEPQAVIRTTTVDVVPFGEVTAEHAHAEGEGDLSLAAWREIHERFWRNHSESPRGWEPDMPVLCERFELVHPLPAATDANA
ncbi:ASCH domain-containing protein [Microbacterium esteraromaticum]|uniref:ASCH domain-containing protein n=1 Tax=Microbacterium esteraromaticum TaxID=57043 RepID=UPI001C951CA3|nr:ASCH domain-containing protein [Microbacterium esteraromaticum]MBY6062659.1 ASCH domain-containing protein [Microbacterium esteraromaticum]